MTTVGAGAKKMTFTGHYNKIKTLGNVKFGKMKRIVSFILF